MSQKTVAGRAVVTASPGYILCTAPDGTQQAIKLDDLARTLQSTAQLGSPSPSANLPSIASGDVLGNSTAGAAQAVDTTLTAMLDRAFGSTKGMMLYRDTSVWKALAAGSNTQVLTLASGIPSWATPTGGGGGVGGLYSGAMSALPTASSTGLTTWLNQGSASTADGATGMTLTMPAGTGANVAGRYKAAPGSTPYKITALLSLTSGNGDGTNNPLAGIGWTDGTKLQHISLLLANVSNAFVQVNGQNTGTSAVSNQFSAQRQWNNPIWLQIGDDGTNATFAYSFDGITFLTAYSVAKASGFLGGSGYTNVGFFVGGTNNNDGVTKTGTLMSWQ